MLLWRRKNLGIMGICKKSNNKFVRYTLPEKIVTFYVAIMFFIYPLYYNNYYFDIVTCRFELFSILTAITVLLCLAAYYIEDGNTTTGDKKEFINKVDLLVLVLWIINFISVLLSDNMQVAIVGTSGRSSGLITITCYVAVYFMITRYYVHSIFIYRLLCLSSIVASIVGSLHFLNIDFLGFYDGLGVKEKAMYFSTMGHANVVASFYGIVLPAVMVLYVNAKKYKEKIFYGFTLVISFLGLFATGCESGAVITGVMVLSGLVMIKDIKKLYHIGIILLFMIVSCKLLILLNAKKNMPRALETFQIMVYNNRIFMILLVILIIITAFSYFMYKRYKKKLIKKEDEIYKNKQYIKWILLFALILILAFIGVIVFFSTVGKDIKLGNLENMLRFNKRFGSYRGYIWGLVIDEYKKLPFINKLFGIGCDTLKPFLMKYHKNEMFAMTGAYYDNAHNEFLQYLITTGIFGLLSYILLLFTKFRQGILQMIHKNSLLTAVAVFGAAGYLLQSVIDINQCVTTPLFVIMVCMMGCKENKRSV